MFNFSPESEGVLDGRRQKSSLHSRCCEDPAFPLPGDCIIYLRLRWAACQQARAGNVVGDCGDDREGIDGGHVEIELPHAGADIGNVPCKADTWSVK